MCLLIPSEMFTIHNNTWLDVSECFAGESLDTEEKHITYTFALWFQIAVDRRGHGFNLICVHGMPPERRGEGSEGT